MYNICDDDTQYLTMVSEKHIRIVQYKHQNVQPQKLLLIIIITSNHNLNYMSVYTIVTIGV